MNLKDLNNLRADTEGRIKAVFLICMFVLVSAGGFAQNTKSISGTVREKGSNETVIGATVQVKGTHNGVITNENGEYTIKNVVFNNLPDGVVKTYQPAVSASASSDKSIRFLCRFAAFFLFFLICSRFNCLFTSFLLLTTIYFIRNALKLNSYKSLNFLRICLQLFIVAYCGIIFKKVS